jgi:hypothetical protein
MELLCLHPFSIIKTTLYYKTVFQNLTIIVQISEEEEEEVKNFSNKLTGIKWHSH